MEDKFKKKLKGNFLQAVLGLMMSTDEFEAHILHTTLESASSIDSDSMEVITQIICTKNHSEIEKLSMTYKKCMLNSSNF